MCLISCVTSHTKYWTTRQCEKLLNVQGADNMTSSQLAMDERGISSPALTLAELLNGVTSTNCYRIGKEVQTEVTKYCAIWKRFLTKQTPHRIFSGENEAVVVIKVLQDLWDQKEIKRVEDNRKVVDKNPNSQPQRRPSFLNTQPYRDLEVQHLFSKRVLYYSWFPKNR